METRVTDYTDDEIAAIAANAAAGTPSLRSLSNTSTTAAAGNDSRIPTQGENDALVGTSGTVGSSNKYVTAVDPNHTGTPTVYNVIRGYGAVGNGVADDTSAIQAAINAANTAG